MSVAVITDVLQALVDWQYHRLIRKASGQGQARACMWAAQPGVVSA